MPLFDRLIPAATIAMTALLVALPWGIDAEFRFLLPLLPLVVIHYWTLRRPEIVAEWWAFAAGLSVDILTHGPLGYWALMYLLGYAAAKMSSVLANDAAFAKWLLAAVTFLGLVIVAWAIASVYYFAFADWRPYLLAALATAIVYPVVGLFLRSLNFLRPAPAPTFTDRGTHEP